MFTVSIDYYYDCYHSRNFHVKSILGILYTSLRQCIARVIIRLRTFYNVLILIFYFPANVKCKKSKAINKRTICQH